MFVLPVSTDHPARHRPYALVGLVAINVAIFLFTWATHGNAALFREYGFVPSAPCLATGFFSMFVHAGFWHIAGNMFFLWMFGANVEDVLGHLFFVLSYLAAGVAAVLLFLVFNSSSSVSLVGASGAISGIVGLYIAFFPKARADLVIYVLFWEITAIRTTAYGAILVWFAEQSILSLLTEATELGQYVHTAFTAHVGGFLAGVVLGLLFRALGFVKRYEAAMQRHWLFGHASNGKPAP